MPHDDVQEWKARALLAEARARRMQQRLQAQFFDHVKNAIRRPLTAPQHLAELFKTIGATLSGRKKAAAQIKTLTAKICGIELSVHAKALSRLMTAEDASQFLGMMEAGETNQAVSLLSKIANESLHAPDDLRVIAARADAAARLAETGWPIKARAKHAPHPLQKNTLCIFHSRSPLVNNGYAARSLEVLAAIASSGWRVHSVTRLGYPQDINKYRTIETPVTEEYGGTPCTLLKDDKDGLRGRSIDDYLNAYATRLVEQADAVNASVLHAASNHLNGLAAIMAARQTGRASIYEARGFWEITSLSNGDLSDTDIRFRRARRLETDALLQADHVITLGETLKREIINMGVAPERITVAPNCVDVSALKNTMQTDGLAKELGLPDDCVAVGYFGAFAHYEGLDILLKALRLAIDQGAKLHVLLGGGGAEEGALKKMARSLNLEDKVRFLGRLPSEDVHRYASLCEIAALPRRELPVTRLVPPIKAAEAMARGQAVIVSDLPALTEIIEPGLTGLAVRPDDPDALAAALKRLAEDEGLRKKMGSTARKAAAERYDRSTLGAKIVSAYASALEQAGARDASAAITE